MIYLIMLGIGIFSGTLLFILSLATRLLYKNLEDWFEFPTKRSGVVINFIDKNLTLIATSPLWLAASMVGATFLFNNLALLALGAIVYGIARVVKAVNRIRNVLNKHLGDSSVHNGGNV